MTDRTDQNYARPYRPWAVKAFNRLNLGHPDRQLDPQRLLAAAHQKTGLDTLSEAPLMEPLEQLCKSLRAEADLSAVGRIIQSARLKNLLINRLRLDALMEEHPEIADQPEPDILLIAGLARTGTTFLHRALAADPQARTLSSWEALNPAPWPNEARGQYDKRLKYGQRAARFMNWLAPDYRAVHPVSSTEPEEDILLLDLTLMSQTAEAVAFVPSYSRWLESCDHRPAYAYLKKILKTLQWLRPGPGRSTHWVLKSPHHGEQLATALDVFPKARVILTHRDPVVTTASCSSLMCHTQALSTDQLRPDRIAAHWLAKSVLMTQNSLKAREIYADRCFIDVFYKDLVQNPARIVEEIYHASRPLFTTEGLSSVLSALNTSHKPSDKKHAYDLADFDLTASAVRAQFQDYLNRYGSAL